MKQIGFSAIELLLALGIIGIVFTYSLRLLNSFTDQVKGQMVAQQAVSYAKAAKRYITTHYNLLQELLSLKGQSNGKIATIPFSILHDEGFVTKSQATNLLRQTPCLVITWNNHQLQSFLYYRATASSKTLDPLSLNSGLQHVGAMIGLYKNGIVTGSGRDWRLDAKTIEKLLIAQGDADPSQGQDSGIYNCSGISIANNSYVINLAAMLSLNNHLPKDDALHEYPDNITAIGDPQNVNTMLSDLNMHYRSGEIDKQHNNIIFQINPDCVMEPSKPYTMLDSTQDPRGCRDKQLAIQTTSANSGAVSVRITGFKQAGNPRDDKVPHPYVGELSAASIQPTAEVAVGTSCDPSTELGKMARQQYNSLDPNDVNNLYISQVQCMVNPLCPTVSNGTCYMPINTVTLQLNTEQNQYAPISKTCPAGTFVLSIDADAEAVKPPACCGSNLGVGYCCHIDDCDPNSKACSMIELVDRLASKNPALYSGIVTTPSRWYQGCPAIHSGCGEG
ncbi:MAG: type II secretion system protein, partial [Burkholderiales bacterium]